MMNRRRFLVGSGALLAANPFVMKLSRFADRRPWRTFTVRTHLEVLRPRGTTRVWLPLPLQGATAYQRRVADTVDPGEGTARVVTLSSELSMVVATWPPGVRPALSAESQVSTCDIHVDWREQGDRKIEAADRARFVAATRMIPTDGIVRKTALAVTQGNRSDLEKARAIYDWIVENTFRDPTVQGCGLGNIRFMLETNNLGGKCADLNALFVGLARAAGIPARDVYGLRVAPSRLECKSLGVKSEVVTTSQHCRAEVHLDGYGWVPVDPADVRKVILEEPPGKLPMDDPRVQRTRSRLFGSWEMNWIAFNYAHDVTLPESTHAPLVYFMYPQAETEDGRIDSLDPEHFKYEITVQERTS